MSTNPEVLTTGLSSLIVGISHPTLLSAPYTYTVSLLVCNHLMRQCYMYLSIICVTMVSNVAELIAVGFRLL